MGLLRQGTLRLSAAADPELCAGARGACREKSKQSGA